VAYWRFLRHLRHRSLPLRAGVLGPPEYEHSHARQTCGQVIYRWLAKPAVKQECKLDPKVYDIITDYEFTRPASDFNIDVNLWDDDVDGSSSASTPPASRSQRRRNDLEDQDRTQRLRGCDPTGAGQDRAAGADERVGRYTL
jgi:hypothetical protein